MKVLRMFYSTSLALEVLRMAIEVQLGCRARFGAYNYWTSGITKETLPSGRISENRNLHVAGWVELIDTKELISLDEATIELNNLEGPWRTGLLWFTIVYKGLLSRYIARSEYRDEPIQNRKVHYPSLVAIVNQDWKGRGKQPFRIGWSSSDVREVRLSNVQEVRNFVM